MSNSSGDATINVAAGQHFITAPVQLNANTDVTAQPGSLILLTGGLSGSGTGETLSINGSGGSVQVINAAAGVVNTGFQVNSGYAALGSSGPGTTSFSGPIGLAAGSSLTLTAASGGTSRFSGAITDGNSGGSIFTAGAGTVVLVATNTYSGGTTVSQGTSSAGVSNLGSGPLTLAGGTFQPVAATSFSNSLSVTQNSTISLPAAAGALQFPALSIGSAMLTLGGGASARAWRSPAARGATGRDGELQRRRQSRPDPLGTVSGTANLAKTGLEHDPLGRQQLPRQHHGQQRHAAPGHSNSLGTGDLTVNGLLLLNGNNASVNGLWGSSGGTIDNQGGGTATLTVGNGNVSSTFSGTIQNTVSGGSVVLFKTGGGALTLMGSNTYVGDTNIAGGTLVAGMANMPRRVRASTTTPRSNVTAGTQTVSASASWAR